jgi:peroxiredoxin
MGDHIMAFILAVLMLSPFGSAKSMDFGLKRDESAPMFEAKDIDGNEFRLRESLQRGPVVLVFYRGGWCPYCNLQLRGLQKEVLPAVSKKGGTLVAISVDSPKEGLKTKSKEELGLTVISDPDAKILGFYKVQFKMSDDLVKTYKSSHSIDIEGASGKSHHIIAVPSVFVIKKNGKIGFAYVNEDYKVRAENKDIVRAIESN